MEEISSSLECPKNLPTAQRDEKPRLICNAVKSWDYGFRLQGSLLRLARTVNRFVGLGDWMGGVARSQGQSVHRRS
jgi:hypothetical protein